MDTKLRDQAGGKLEIARQSNLNFSNPLDGYQGSRTSSVPAGFNREVHFAVIGSDQALAKAFYPAIELPLDRKPAEPAAALCLYPARNDQIAYISVPPGGAEGSEQKAEYELILTVTGANFDAKTYRATLYATFERGPEYGVPSVELGWVTEPTAVKP